LVVGPSWFVAERLPWHYDLGFDLLILVPFVIVGAALTALGIATHERRKQSGNRH